MTRWMTPLLVIAALCSGSLALADDKDDAERLFRAAEKFFEAGQYDEAADSFERAYDVLPLPAIAFSAAQAYRLQYFKDRKDASLKRSVELYRDYIAAQKEGGRVADAVAILAELEPLLSRAEQRGAIGRVTREEKTGIVVTSQTPGATAQVNDGAPAAMPLAVVVAPGKHTVRVEAVGFAPFSKTVDVVAGQVLAVEGELVALPVKLVIKAKTGSTVTIDGRPVGATPLAAPIEIDSGAHHVAVTQRGHHAQTRTFLAGRGEDVAFELDMKRTLQRKIAYVVLATGATLFAGSSLAAFSALGANGAANELDDRRQAQGLSAAEALQYNDRLNERDSARTLSLGLLGAALATGAVGGLLYFLDSPSADRPPESAKVSPTVASDGAGVALIGRF